MAELLGAMHSPGAEDRTIAAPFGEVPADDLRPLRRLRRPGARLGSRHRHRSAYAPREALVAEVDAFIRQLLMPEMRDGDTFAAETEAPPEAEPVRPAGGLQRPPALIKETSK